MPSSSIRLTWLGRSPFTVPVKRYLGVAVAGLLALGVAAALLRPSRTPHPTAAPFVPPLRAGGRVKNVVLVTIDTLRADHLSLYGYPRQTTPHIDAFARAAMTYENAYATATFTSPSLVSMLTGLYPASHGVRFLRQSLPPDTWTLPGHLRGLGWHTGAVVSNWVLKAGASGLAGEFDEYDDEMTERELKRPDVFERTGERTTDAALRWLGSRTGTAPFFLWVHYIDPHGPYTPPAPFDEKFAGPPGQRVKRAKIPWYQRVGKSPQLGHYIDQYDGEIAYVDEQIGRLFRGLHGQNLLGDTMVVLTSDHGETLTDRHGGPVRYFHHGHHVWEELARIPLLVYEPSGPVGRSRDLVSLVDIAPTILESAGVPHPTRRFDGVALAAHHGEPVFFEAANKRLRAVRWDRFKLIANVPTATSKAVRTATVFDLTADPRERAGNQPSAARHERLLAALDTYLAADRQDLEALRSEVRAALARTAAPDGRDVSRLRALGYVE